MQMVDWDEVRERTIALYRRDRRRLGGGVLAPVLTEDQVEEFERQIGVALPDDYREYLLRVSAGGRVRELRRDQTGWRLAGDRDTNYANLRTPFPDQDAALAACEELWSRPPLEGDYASAEAFQAAHDMWRQAADAADAARAVGAMFLQGHGCGFSTLLVISGPMRGTMWFDGRATSDRLNPLLNDSKQPSTFAEWYLDWLTWEESLTTPEQREAASERWHRGVDLPIWFRWFVYH